jgi:hypothetical protein
MRRRVAVIGTRHKQSYVSLTEDRETQLFYLFLNSP